MEVVVKEEERKVSSAMGAGLIRSKLKRNSNGRGSIYCVGLLLLKNPLLGYEHSTTFQSVKCYRDKGFALASS